MPGAPSQPASVHTFHGDHRPTPDSLQQPHLTEETLQKMPVTSIGMQEQEQSPPESETSQALVVANAAGLLLPGGLTALFCGAGPPGTSAAPPPTPPDLGGVDLRPYPRDLLQIVSDQRGPVGVPAGPADARRPGEGRAESEAEMVAADTVRDSKSAGLLKAASVPLVEERAVSAVSAPLSRPAPLPHAAGEHQSSACRPSAGANEARGEMVVTSTTAYLSQAAPRSPAAAEVAQETEADAPCGRSDGSTVTAESAPTDAEPLPVDDDDDRLSVVSSGSAWSDISGFEEDLWRLKSVLRDPTAPPDSAAAPCGPAPRRPPPPQPPQPPAGDQLQLHRLQLQLQHASQERELYRQQLEALQGQMTGGSQRQHFEVQRQKAHLEGVLEVTRRELEEVGAERGELRQQVTRQQLELRAAASGSLRAERDSLAAEAALLRGRARDLDSQLAEARGRLEAQGAEVAAAREELRQSEAAGGTDRLALEQARREAETRDATVAALKAKVAELVVEAQQRLQERLRAESTCQGLREELEQRERSRDWYKTQLKASQEVRLQQQQQLMVVQTELIAQKNSAERLRGELALAQQTAAATQARAVREKESLMRHLENIQADMLQREALFKAAKHGSAPPPTGADEPAGSSELDQAKAEVRSLELTVAELRQQLEKANEQLAAAAAASARLEKDNEATRFSLAACQEKLSQQTTQTETLRLRCQEGGQMLTQLRAQAKEDSAARLALKEEKTRLEVALASANQEKRDVDDAARGLSNELKKVSASFYKLKNDVSVKDKQLEELKVSLNARESELRACHDKLEEASKLKIQAEQVSEKMKIFDNMNEQNKQLMVQNHELRYKVQQLTQDRSVLDQGRVKLEEVVRNLQRQVNESVQREANTKATLDERNSLIRDLEDQGDKSKEELVAVKNYARNLRQNSRENAEDPATPPKSPDISDTSSPGKNDMPEDNRIQEMGRQISLLSVQNRELERRLVLAARPAGEPADAAALRQENAALTARVTELTGQLQRLQADAENRRRAADAAPPPPAELAERDAAVRRLQEQLQLSQTRNKQLQQQLAAARRPDGAPAAPVSTSSATSGGDESRRLAEELAAAQAAYKERHRCYQSNIRVLTRKLREYMRALKTAERELAERRAAPAGQEARRAVELDEALAQQRRQLETAQRDAQRARQETEELRAKAGDAQLLSLEVEKERGRLEGMAQSYSALQRRAAELEALLAGYEEQRLTAREQTPAEQRRLEQQLQQLEQELTQEQLDAKELRRQLFSERRETSRLKKEAASLQTGLQTAEDVAQARQAQLAEQQAALEAARGDLAQARAQLSDQRAAYDACQRQAAEARRQAEQSAANDPVLAQQIKTLSGHLHQKNAELQGLQEQGRLVEQRHLVEMDGLRKSLVAASEELQQLKGRLDTTREEKFTLQSQTTELRSALQTSSEQIRELHGQIRELEGRLRASDLDLSSLRVPAPSPMDETRISRLLEQSAGSVEPRPLEDLQACLHSLKQEMSALQTQIHQTDPWPKLPEAAGAGDQPPPAPDGGVTSAVTSDVTSAGAVLANGGLAPAAEEAAAVDRFLRSASLAEDSLRLRAYFDAGGETAAAATGEKETDV